MVEKLAALLGMDVPVQFEPLLYVVAGVFLLYLVTFFAEFLRHIILRR